MKKEIHPQVNEVTTRCACGNSFNTLSTSRELKTTLCSACHPFFTGTQKFVDTAGRIEKFEKKYSAEAIAQRAKEQAALKKAASAQKKAPSKK